MLTFLKILIHIVSRTVVIIVIVIHWHVAAASIAIIIINIIIILTTSSSIGAEMSSIIAKDVRRWKRWVWRKWLVGISVNLMVWIVTGKGYGGGVGGRTVPKIV
jgi:hypothetical protein